MARTLYLLGSLIMVAGFIAGVYFGDQANPLTDNLSYSSDKVYHWNLAITYWLSGGISGILFIAIGMLLDQAQELIKNQHAIMTKFEIPFEQHAQESVEEVKESSVPNLGE